MASEVSRKTDILRERGVNLTAPATVEIGEDVDVERISPASTIHAGCRIRGERTSIGPGAEIGAEAPVTLVDCQLGGDVELKGGYFCESTFLGGASVGSGAHVRSGTLLEEYASAAHTVGLKQTLLFPFVTLGSLVNFCDCLMAGGTGAGDHSEVGSSYVHFNFTPHGDKATPSLLGDVPRGVLVNQNPVFLGGQGGLVGPARIEYGVVIPAGEIWRGDALEEDKLVVSENRLKPGAHSYIQGLYFSIERILRRNFEYIGNIYALKCWYSNIRSLFLKNGFDTFCQEGALERIESILSERIKRLDQFADKLERSLEIASEREEIDADKSIFRRQREFRVEWPQARQVLLERLENTEVDEWGEGVVDYFRDRSDTSDYIEAIRTLPEETTEAVSSWLQNCVDKIQFA